MILTNKNFVLSDFKSTFLQRVRFYINFFTTRQNLNQLFYNASDSEQVTYVHHMYFSHRFPPYIPVQLQATMSSSTR